ncbi:MAG: ribbon-helix-helix protein, CopG family [Chloroflexota bacterium]|nr:ribbon-helix-helix protein, CopG family [Chloroflexota bacterium]MDQ5867313.1 ribbon-helix-helix protein, CopG family [Chloroflexota bacterium]
MPKITSIRLEDETAAQLDALTKSMDRPRAWLIDQAIKSYIAEQSWQITAIKEALEDYRSGQAELVPHEAVMDEMAALEAEIRAELR